MSGNSKRNVACSWCLAGALSVGALASGAAGLVRAADHATHEAPPAAGAAALADDAHQGHQGHQAPAAARKQVDAVVRSYLAVQKLLAADKAEGVGAEFKKIREAAATLSKGDDEKVVVQAKTVAKHADADPKGLKEARTAFKSLSAAVIGLVQLVPQSADAAPVLYEATCDMAKANWLQASKEIVNPYMGRQMLRCGSVERKIEAAPGGKADAQGLEALPPAARPDDAAASAARAGGCCASPVGAPEPCGAQ